MNLIKNGQIDQNWSKSSEIDKIHQLFHWICIFDVDIFNLLIDIFNQKWIEIHQKLILIHRVLLEIR